MECHKCPFDGKGDPRCVKCVSEKEEPLPNNHGRVFVSTEEVAGTRFEPSFDPTAAMLAAVDEREGQAEVEPSLPFPPEVAEVLGDFFRQLMLLDPREWRVLSLMCVNLWNRPRGNPLTLKEIGTRAANWLHYPKAISKQEVKAIIADVFAKVPSLPVLFPRMSITYRWKQQLRRDGVLPHQKRSRGVARQAEFDLFPKTAR